MIDEKKLIERLEEEKQNDTCISLDEEQKERCFWYKQAFKKAIKIVNQLAEEYNNDFCEWEDTESLRKKGVCYSSDGLYKPSCNNNEDDFRDWNWIRHFEFCPYCGKKIKVVE